MLAQLFRQEISALRIVDADSRLEIPDSRFPIPIPDRRYASSECRLRRIRSVIPHTMWPPSR